MKRYIETLRRATWTYRQSLTRFPHNICATVSDLFVWRNSDEWETYFELINMLTLFPGQEGSEDQVTLVFFDAFGQAFLDKTISITSGRRQTVALSEIIGKDSGFFGTFAVFHAQTPTCLQLIGSHLAERGYVSYRYRGAPLRSYVHGNIDAITRLPNDRLQMLGGHSLRRREYNLQLSIVTEHYYELGIVNTTAKKHIIRVKSLTLSGEMLCVQTIKLTPRGCHLFRIAAESAQQRIVISSHLVMARPLVFQIWDQKMDVFHG